MSRADPLPDLSEFTPKAQPPRPVVPQQIDRLSNELGFPSRQPEKPKKRRHTTGRNQQLNIKASAETVALFYQLADQLELPHVQVLEQALQALERSQNR